MDWVAILSGAIDGAALALAFVAVVFGYRAITASNRERNFLVEMQRQDKFGTLAVIAALLATALIAIKQIAL